MFIESFKMSLLNHPMQVKSFKAALEFVRFVGVVVEKVNEVVLALFITEQ